MHSITLSFPTIAELHDAVARLRGEVVAEVASVKAEVVSVEKAVVAAVKGKSKPATAPATAPAPVAAASAPAPAASAPAVSAADAGVDYPTLQKAVFKLAGLNRDAATGLCATFNVKTFKDLDSSRWAEALTAVETKLAELAVPA